MNGSRLTVRLGFLAAALALAFITTNVSAQITGTATAAQDAEVPIINSGSPERRLWREISALVDELQQLRVALAQARLEADEARRERDELREFIEDHEELGDAYEQYRGIREVAEREQRRRAAEAARERREVAMREQQERLMAFRQEREAERAEARRIRQYREAGFSSLGLDVFLSRSSYHYSTRDYTARLRYEPLIGWYQRYFRDDEIDFSEMTISGAILNASDEVRNIGVAIAFFDERGVQVGQETIHITNARPDVPYPFTSTVAMALDRPFASSTSYVLYADPIDDFDAFEIEEETVDYKR